MRIRHHGGTHAGPGYYWNVKGWTMATMPREGGLLPGPAEHHYVKVPALLLLGLAPLLGGLFVVFLPFIGFALVFSLIGKKAIAATYRMAEDLYATRAWRPGEAYFTDEEKPRETGERTGSGTSRG
jgi:hypothetical protein